MLPYSAGSSKIGNYWVLMQGVSDRAIMLLGKKDSAYLFYLLLSRYSWDIILGSSSRLLLSLKDPELTSSLRF